MGEYIMILVDKQKTATSNGCLSKVWYKNNNDIYLVKGNMCYKSGFKGYEPYAEVIASIVADVLSIPHVPYTLAPASNFRDVHVYDCDYVSVCRKYEIPKGVQKLSAIEYLDAFYGKSINTNFWSAIIRTPVDKKCLCDMLLFDAIIGNNDRHLNNWEYVISENGEVRQLPLFDNGSSLLAFEEELPHTIPKIGRDLSKPFARTHFKQVSLIKKCYPSYCFNINKVETWNVIDVNIKPVLNLIDDKKRATLMYDYLYKRFNFYIDYVNGGTSICG